MTHRSLSSLNTILLVIVIGLMLVQAFYPQHRSPDASGGASDQIEQIDRTVAALAAAERSIGGLLEAVNEQSRLSAIQQESVGKLTQAVVGERESNAAKIDQLTRENDRLRLTAKTLNEVLRGDIPSGPGEESQ